MVGGRCNVMNRSTGRMTALGVLLVLALLWVPFQGTWIGVSPSAAAPATLPLWPHEISDLQADPAIVFGKLKNGFRFVLMKNQNPAQRVSMHLNIQAGSAQETDSQQGLAHFLEHMLFNGSENFAPGELVKYFQSIGMQFGPDANAHTGFYETVYDILLPQGDAENLKKGLTVMKDYAEGALLLDSEIERERKVILAEKRTRDSASYRTFESTFRFELPDTRIAQRLPIGREDVLQQAVRSDFKAYYDTWYRPDNMMVVAVGDFDVQTAQELIRTTFENMSPRGGEPPSVTFGEIRHQGIKPFYHYEKESGNVSVTLEVLAKEAPQNDRAELRRQRVKRDLADQIVQNRLDALIGRDGSPGTSAAVGSGVYLTYVRYAMITAEGNPEQWPDLLRFIEQQLRKALEFGFTEPELERVKKDFLSELDLALKKQETRESKNLARTIIRTVNANEVLMSPADEKELLSDYIRSLTPADIHQAFQGSWQPAHRLILVTGNADLTAGTAEPNDRILEIYRESLAAAVAPPAVERLLSFPYLPVPEEAGRITQRREHPQAGIIQIDFENGFRLNLKKTDFKDDEILAKLTFGSGRYGEPESLPGLAGISADVVNESGLGELSRDQLESALAGKQTRIAFKVQESAFAFSGDTIPDELELFFQLLQAHIQDPGFRPDAFRLKMKQLKSRIEEISHTPGGVMTLKGNRFLAGGDSRFGGPLQDDIERIALTDIQDWVGQSLSQDPLELSLAGDFEVDTAIALAARYLGTLPSRSATPLRDRGGPVFPVGGSLRMVVDTDIPKGMVVVAYPTEDIWSIHRTRRLAVLADIFSERMRVQIREKLGEAYSPTAYNQAFRAYEGYGIFHTIVEVNPSQSDRVVAEIKKIASDIARNGVSADEVHRSLKPTLNSIRDMRQRNEYWLNTVLTESKKHPQQIEWSLQIEKDYASIIPQDIDRLAAAYLKNERAAVVVAAPAPKN